MTDVMLIVTVTDKTGFINCSKLTKIPALMPVGSTIIIHGPDEWEVETTITDYYWGDDESFVRVHTSKLAAGSDPLAQWKREFEGAGWACKQYARS